VILVGSLGSLLLLSSRTRSRLLSSSSMVVLTRSRVILVAGSLFIVLLFVYLLDTPSGIHAAQQRGTSSSSSSGGSGGTAIPSRSTCITSVDAENRCRDAELMSKMLSWESVIAAGIAGVQAPSSIAASLDRLYWSHCIQDPDQLRMVRGAALIRIESAAHTSAWLDSAWLGLAWLDSAWLV